MDNRENLKVKIPMKFKPGMLQRWGIKTPALCIKIFQKCELCEEYKHCIGCPFSHIVPYPGGRSCSAWITLVLRRKHVMKISKNIVLLYGKQAQMDYLELQTEAKLLIEWV